MSEYTRNLAVVGAGYWGKNLVRNFHELGVLHTVCDKDERLFKELLDSYGGIKVTVDFGSLLKSEQIISIAISTPVATHYALAKKALEAGKHVFVEKPLAQNSREAESLLRLAEKKKRILMVGHILQYHPAALKLKDLISRGRLGRIRYIYSNRLNIGKLRTEENILWSFAPHDISLLLMLLGCEPVKVSAFGGDYLNKGIYDTTLTVLDFAKGVKAHIFVSWLHPYKEQKLIVVGTKKMAVFDDLSLQKLVLYPHKIKIQSGKIPLLYKAKHIPVPVEKKEPLNEELRHFISCVSSGRRPRTDGYEGLRVLRVLEEAEKSLAENKKNEKA